MNRTLVLGLLAATVAWIILYLYIGSGTTLYIIAASELIAVNIAIVVHMFLDRGWRDWSASTVGILLGTIGWILLFGWFEYRYVYGRASLSLGVSQGWIDAVIACVLIGSPMLLISIVRLRLQLLREERKGEPGELLRQGIPERRRVLRRRADKQAYDAWKREQEAS